MNKPELYIHNNTLQQNDAINVFSKYVEKMTWKPNEMILDIGCGPGNVTLLILNNILKYKVKKLIALDKSSQVIELAKERHAHPQIEYITMNIENTTDCDYLYSGSFDKLISFYCFNWIFNKIDALRSMYSMLKSGGEILVVMVLHHPLLDAHKLLDPELQKYGEVVIQRENACSTKEEATDLFIKAGFKIISVETTINCYTYPNYSSLLDFYMACDDMYAVLPLQLHEKYSTNIKEKLLGTQFIKTCPVTGEITSTYFPLIVHATK